MAHLPPMVDAALSVARALGYDRACSDGMGLFLQVLASSVVRGRMLIYGAGTGVASAWIIQTMSPYARLVAYEPNSRLAKASRPIIGEKAVVVEEEPGEVLRRGPFSFVFVNVARNRVPPANLVDEIVPGGMVVVGNFGSEATEEVVEEWEQVDGFTSTKVLVEGNETALVLTRQVV